MSLSSAVTIAEPALAQGEPKPLARYLKPALGLVLPVGLAIVWELAVRAGLLGRPPRAAALAHLGDAGRTGRSR